MLQSTQPRVSTFAKVDYMLFLRIQDRDGRGENYVWKSLTQTLTWLAGWAPDTKARRI
jgi:hypothetical protein